MGGSRIFERGATTNTQKCQARSTMDAGFEQTNFVWNHPWCCSLQQAVALFHCAWTVLQPLPAETFATLRTILAEAEVVLFTMHKRIKQRHKVFF
jgi:hypothetical protein